MPDRTPLTDEQIDSLLEQVRPMVGTMLQAVWAPFRDGLQIQDIPVAGVALVGGLMSIAGPLDILGADKKRLVVRAAEQVLAAHREQIDIPWLPGWLDDPIEDAMISRAPDLVEIIYSAAAKVAPFDRILG